MRISAVYKSRCRTDTDRTCCVRVFCSHVLCYFLLFRANGWATEVQDACRSCLCLFGRYCRQHCSATWPCKAQLHEEDGDDESCADRTVSTERSAVCQLFPEQYALSAWRAVWTESLQSAEDILRLYSSCNVRLSWRGAAERHAGTATGRTERLSLRVWPSRLNESATAYRRPLVTVQHMWW